MSGEKNPFKSKQKLAREPEPTDRVLRGDGPAEFPRGIVNPAKEPVVLVPTMSDAQIKALTDGFQALTQTLTEAPASGPLLNLEKFNVAASDWIKEFEEACTLSNYTDATRYARFAFYLASGAGKQWYELSKSSFTNWTTLKSAFLKEFVPEDEKWRNEQKLRARKLNLTKSP